MSILLASSGYLSLRPSRSTKIIARLPSRFDASSDERSAATTSSGQRDVLAEERPRRRRVEPHSRTHRRARVIALGADCGDEGALAKEERGSRVADAARSVAGVEPYPAGGEGEESRDAKPSRACRARVGP